MDRSWRRYSRFRSSWLYAALDSSSGRSSARTRFAATLAGRTAPSVWKALLHMVTAPRPVTLFILTGLQGFILGGLLDTGVSAALAGLGATALTNEFSRRWCSGFSSSMDSTRSVRDLSSSEPSFPPSSCVVPLLPSTARSFASTSKASPLAGMVCSSHSVTRQNIC